jgi:hypothetical protein
MLEAISAQRDALRSVEWHGSRREGRALLRAINAHCTCMPYGPLCAAHEIVCDQAALDSLLRLRRAGISLPVQ